MNLKIYIIKGNDIEPYITHKYVKICLLSDLKSYLDSEISCECVGVDELKEQLNKEIPNQEKVDRNDTPTER